MQEWINQTLESPTLSLAVAIAAFALGLVSSVASVCCTLPILGAIVGYSGTREQRGRWAALFGGFFFMSGSIIALVVLGSVAAFIGQVAQNTLGKYWKLFAGLVAIFFGLGTLNLLPFKLPKRTSEGEKTEPRGLVAAAVFGLVIGGVASVCSLCCNPGIFIVLGVVVLQGYSLWAMTLLVAYAIGFALPLTAVVLGVSLGKTMTRAKKTDTVIRIVAGVLLIAAGFYFLASM